jgi:hypothetical protein
MLQARGFLLKTLVFIVLLTLALSGCGGGSDGDGEGGGDPVDTATLSQFNTALNAVMNTAGDALGQVEMSSEARQARREGGTRQATIDLNVACPENGSFLLSGQADFNDPTFSFNAELTLNGCNGIDGMLTYTGEATLSGDIFSFSLRLDGDVSTQECTVNFAAFEQSASGNTNTQDFVVFLGGSISATCNGASFRCTMDGLSISDSDASGDADMLDQQVYEDRCYLT